MAPNSRSTMTVPKTAPKIGAGATYVFQVTLGSTGMSLGVCMVGVGGVELDVELREKTLAMQLSTCRGLFNVKIYSEGSLYEK